MKYSKLLVLDLDETLIHTVEPSDKSQTLWEPFCRTSEGYKVHIRPGLHDFLEGVLTRFEAVGIWTAGTQDYAEEILDLIISPNQFLKIKFVYFRNRCSLQRDLETNDFWWIKDIKKLKKFGFDKKQILFVDDKAAGLKKSYGNLIKVPEFNGDPNDQILQKLLIYLDEIGNVENVRSIEKRTWNTWNKK